MISHDVEPLADDTKSPRALRDMIHAARHEVPSDEQLGSLMSRLAGIEAAASAGAGSSLLKWMPVITVLALVVGGSFWALGRESKPAGEPLGVHQVARVPSEQEVERVIQEAPETSASHEPAPATEIKPPPVVKAATPSEPQLVQAARRALQSKQWNQSMRLVRTHEKQYPQGILSEEREAIAVEALALSGELARARARLSAMATSYPGSSYRAYLESLSGLGSE